MKICNMPLGTMLVITKGERPLWDKFEPDGAYSEAERIGAVVKDDVVVLLEVIQESKNSSRSAARCMTKSGIGWIYYLGQVAKMQQDGELR